MDYMDLNVCCPGGASTDALFATCLFSLFLQLSCSGTDFLPYMMDETGLVTVEMGGLERGDLKSAGDKPLSLFSAMKKVLKEVEACSRWAASLAAGPTSNCHPGPQCQLLKNEEFSKQSFKNVINVFEMWRRYVIFIICIFMWTLLFLFRTHVKEKFLSDLRKARVQYKGVELAKVLQSMRNRMDDPQLLAPDVILNMLISYRDVQVCWPALWEIHEIVLSWALAVQQKIWGWFRDGNHLSISCTTNGMGII